MLQSLYKMVFMGRYPCTINLDHFILRFKKMVPVIKSSISSVG